MAPLVYGVGRATKTRYDVVTTSEDRCSLLNIIQAGLTIIGILFALAGTSNAQSNKTQNAPAPPVFAYVTNAPGKDLIFQFRVGPDGTLAPLSPPSVPTGRFPQAIAAAPKGRFVYAVNATDCTLSQYHIQEDGTLRPLSPPTLTLPGKVPYDLVVAPDAHTVYVATRIYQTPDPNGEAVVSQFHVNADGTLSPLTPATVSLKETGTPVSITTDPQGRFVYVANYDGHDVSPLRINKDGTLMLLTPRSIGGDSTCDVPSSVITDANGRFVYVGYFSFVAGEGAGAIWQYRKTPEGALAPLTPGYVSYAPPESGDNSPHLAHHPTLPVVYVTDAREHNLYTYNGDTRGALSPVRAANLTSGAEGLAVAPSGRFLYVAGTGSSGGLVWQFAIGSDGIPTPLTPAVVSAGQSLRDIVVVQPQQAAGGKPSSAKPSAVRRRRTAQHR